MPLDAVGTLNFDIPTYNIRFRSLTTALVDLRIKPVATEVLHRHMADEVFKHPASFLFRHQSTMDHCLATLFLVGGACCVFSFVGLLLAAFGVADMFEPCLGGLCLGFIVMLSVIFVPSSFMVKGPAIWETETRSDDLSDVPADIADMAIQIKQQVPNCWFVIGTLKQANVVLDPFLIVRTMNEDAVIGIWDGDLIIAKATQG